MCGHPEQGPVPDSLANSRRGVATSEEFGSDCLQYPIVLPTVTL